MSRSVTVKVSDQEISSSDITVFPHADARSHTFTVRVQLPEGTSNIFPGMLTKVEIETGRKQRLLIDSRAIVHRSEVTAVYVVDEADQRVRMRYVQVGRQYNGQVEILAGLDAGETIALDPVAAGIYLNQPADRS
jgi:multidrug efflux pump subunit AcrA (membrane-fusion protein)